MILIADQKRMVAEMLARRLRAEGLESEVAGDEAGALAAAQQRGISLVIFDPAPPVNGMVLLRKLKASPNTRDIPVILFSAGDERAEQEIAHRNGVAAYLVKGRVSPNFLVDRIKLCLGTTPTPAVAAPAYNPAIYDLQLQADAGDAPRLAQTFGFTEKLTCRVCGGAVKLRLGLDASKGRLTSGALSCPRHPSMLRRAPEALLAMGAAR